MLLLILSDGPAEGHYETQRAPLFLRAVVPTRGKKDVLDQLDDVPGEGERVSVYRRTNSAAAVRPWTSSGRWAWPGRSECSGCRHPRSPGG